MSLNAEDDQEFGPLDVSKGPTLITPPADGSSSNQVQPEDLFDAPVMAGELPVFSGQIIVQEALANRLVDLAALRRDVQLSGGVSMEDAAALDAIQPGFISEDRPAGFFTEEKTLTQYKETLLSINGYVDKNHEDLKGSVLDLADRIHKAASATDAHFRGMHVTALTAVNRALVQLLMATEASDVAYVRYTFNNRIRWSQFLKLNIYDLVGDGVTIQGEGMPTHVTGFEGTLAQPFLERFGEILKDRDIRFNLDSLNNVNRDPAKFRVQLLSNVYTVDANSVMQPVLPDPESGSVQQDIPSKASTLGGFIELIGDSRLRDFIKVLQGVYTNELAMLAKIPAQVAELEAQTDTNLQARVDALVELSSMVNRAHYQMQGIVFILCGIFKFMAVVKDLIDALTKTQTSPVPV